MKGFNKFKWSRYVQSKNRIANFYFYEVIKVAVLPSLMDLKLYFGSLYH